MKQIQRPYLILIILFVLIITGYFVFFKKPMAKPFENNTPYQQDMPPIEQKGLKTYTTPPEKTMGGNFRFKYRPDLYVAYDELGALKEADPKEHIIILRHVEYRNIKTSGADQKGFPLYEPVIEINNVLFHQCQDYARCVEVKGIPIGTNSQDSSFLELFDEVVKSFEVLE